MTNKKLHLWDETFPALCLKGEGIIPFLHGQTTVDVLSKSEEENIFRSCWLSTKGTLRALLEIRISLNICEIIVLGGEINSLKEGFDSVIFPADKVYIEGIKYIRRIQEISEEKSWKKSTFNWLETKELMSSNDKKKNGKMNYKELQIWKLKQGIPSLGREINEATNPYELGLGDLVKLDKGCYLGQEAMARFARGKTFKHQLRYWEAYGEINAFEIGKRFQSTNEDDSSRKNSGVITSSINVKDNYFNGLALIKNHSLENGDLLSINGDSISFKKPISFVDP